MRRKVKKRKKNNRILLSSLVFGLFLIVGIYSIAGDKKEENVGKVPNISFYEFSTAAISRIIEKPNIEARSALVVRVDSSGNKEIVFAKNEDSKVPIASITKLMTVLIILEQYNLEETVVITEKAFSKDFSRLNNFYVGEQYKVKDLLYPLLMESSNTTAYALAQKTRDPQSTASIDPFVALMNQKAKELGMNNTYFINPSGLDPTNVNDTTNYSTAEDLAVLIEYLIEKPLIWEILSLPSFNLVRMDGFPKHTIINTNALIGEIPKMIGGKTGTTSRALQCLALVIKKDNQEYLISIILGSRDRFNETRAILDWIGKVNK